MKEHWELLAGLIAVAAGLWHYIKGLLGWLTGMIVSTRRADETTSRIIIAYLTRDGNLGMARSPTYGSHIYYIKPIKRSGRVAFQDLLVSGSQVFWNKGRPIRYFQEKEGAPDGYDATFTFFRGTVDWDQLLIDAMDWKLNNKSGSGTYAKVRHRIVYHHGKTLGGELAEQQRKERGASHDEYRFGWDANIGQRLLRWRAHEIGSADERSLDGLGLSPEIEDVLEEIRFWHRSKEWYADRRLPWRRGYMFYGTPGTGKTTLAREISMELDLPVHFMDLASMSNEDLRDAWTEATKDTPCMVLIEDIDAVFRGRENVAPGGGMMSSGGLTFDCLLNCVDGIERADGLLFVITTNVVDHVDDALTRAGRVDRSVKFGPLGYEERLKVAKTILGNNPMALRRAQETGDVPASAFVEICCRDALEALYRDRSEKERPDPELKKEILKG